FPIFFTSVLQIQKYMPKDYKIYQFDYSKSKNVKMSSFKAKYEKVKSILNLRATRGFMNMQKKIKDMIPL
ncbi:hypothetical protein CER22_30110, partial [Bacillus sp. K2I17]